MLGRVLPEFPPAPHCPSPALEDLYRHGVFPPALPLKLWALEEIRSVVGREEAASIAATLQNGPIALWQLRALGFSDREIQGRLDRRFLHRVFKGVYLLGRMDTNPLTRPTAGLLAAGEGSTISRFTVVQLLDLWRPQPTVHVTVPGTTRSARPGLRIHGDQLAPDDIMRFEGLPITTPARTIVDLAHLVEHRELERLIDQALISELTTVDALRAAAHRTPAILRILEEPGDIGAARSRVEAKLAKLIRSAGLPKPEQNAVIGGHEYDFVWWRERLIAEYDSWLYHHTPLRAARDREKTNHAQAAGFAIFRYTDAVLTQPEPTLVELGVELAKRR